MPARNLWRRLWKKSYWDKEGLQKPARQQIPESTSSRTQPDPYDRVGRRIEAQERRDLLHGAGTRQDSTNDVLTQRYSAQPPAALGNQIYFDMKAGFTSVEGKWVQPPPGAAPGYQPPPGVLGIYQPAELPDPILTEPNETVYWDPSTNTLTLRDTGHIARYGVQAYPDEDLAQRLTQMEQAKELEVIQEYLEQQHVVTNLEGVPAPTSDWRAPMVLKGDQVVPDTPDRYISVMTEMATLLTEHWDADDAKFDDQDAERRFLELVTNEREMRPWAGTFEDLMWIMGREGEEVPVELKEETGLQPWTERSEGSWANAIIKGLLQPQADAFGGITTGPTMGTGPLGLGISDADLNTVLGGPFFEGINRWVRETWGWVAERAPALNAFSRALPVLRDMGADALKGILPGAVGSMMGEQIKIPGIGYDATPDEINRFWGRALKSLPFGELPMVVREWGRLLSRENIEQGFTNEEVVAIANGSLWDYLTEVDPERVAHREGNIEGLRQSIIRWTQMSPADRILDVDQISDEERRRLLGDELDDEYRTVAQQNATLAETMQRNTEVGTALSTYLRMARGSATPESIQMALDAAWSAWSNVYYANKARTDTWSFSFRHTWNWSPNGAELERQADQAVIAAMVQKGRLLQNYEVEAITNRFTEVGPELMGEIVFDTLNLIPGKVISGVANGVFKGILPDVFEKTLNLLPLRQGEFGTLARQAAGRFFRTGALQSQGTRLGNAFDNALIGIRHAVGVDEQAYGNAVELLVKAIKDPDAMAELRRLYNIRQSTADWLVEAGVHLTEGEIKAAITWGDDAAGVGDIVYQAFLRAKRLEFEGMNLLDEGLLGLWNKVDPAFVHMPDPIRDIVVSYQLFQKKLMRHWTKFVLQYRPAYTVINHVDNTFRMIVNGVNIFSDFGALVERNEHFITDELIGSFAKRAPEFGGDMSVARAILSGELQPTIRHAFMYGWDNMATKWPRVTHPFWRFVSGLSSMNNASELFARLRVYDVLRAKNLKILRPLFEQRLDDILAQYPPELERIVRAQLLTAADNPGRLRSLLYGEGGLYTNFVPEGYYDELVTMFGDERAAQDLIRTIGNEVHGLYTAGQLTPENIQAIADDLLDQARYAFEHSQSLARDLSHAGGAIPGIPGELDFGFDHVFRVGPDGEAQLTHLFDGTERAVYSITEDALVEARISDAAISQDSILLRDGEITPVEYFERLRGHLTPEQFDDVMTRINTRLGEEVGQLPHAEDILRAGLPDWVTEELDRLGRAGGAPLNQWDLVDPKVREALEADPFMVWLQDNNPDLYERIWRAEAGMDEIRVAMQEMGMPAAGISEEQAILDEALRIAEEGTPAPTAADRMNERLVRMRDNMTARGDKVPEFFTEEWIESVEIGLDEILLDELQEDIAMIAREYDIQNMTADEAGALLRTANEVKDMAGQLRSRVTSELMTTLDNLAARGAFESAPQAERFINQYMRQIQDVFAGPHRRFAAEVFPGPVRMQNWGGSRLAWKQYYEIQARLHHYTIWQSQQFLDLLKVPEEILEQGGNVAQAWLEGNLQQLAGRYNDGMLDLPTWSEVFTGRSRDVERILPDHVHLNWDVQWNPNGSIQAIRYGNGPLNYLDAQDFMRYFGVDNIDDWFELPIGMRSERARQLEATAEELAAEAAEQVRHVAERDMVRGRLWNELLDSNYIPGDDMERFIGRRGVWTHMLGDEAVTSPENFRTAVRAQIKQLRATGQLDAARQLEHRLYSLEAELSAMLRMEGYDTVQLLGPIPRTRLPDNIRTALNIQDISTALYNNVDQAINNWNVWMRGALENDEWFVAAQNLGEDAVRNLASLGDDVANEMSAMLTAAHEGGDYAGTAVRNALGETNEIMVDYSKFGGFDRFMKENIAPFWMFPRYSLPMWLNQFAQKPWLLSLYYKYMRGSERWAYIRGAIDRKGNQLPSLRGYYPVPFSENTWFNPTAMFSARYAVPDFNKLAYDDQAGDFTPAEQFGNWIIQYGRLFGMSYSPLVNHAMYNYFGMLDENRIPPSSLFPQTKLVPPFIQDYVMRLLAKWDNEAAANIENFLDPNTGWKDFLIEYRILTDALEQIQAHPEMSQQDITNLVDRTRRALQTSERDADEELMGIYDDARMATEMSDYYRNTVGYFTGVYFKPYTTARSEFNALRRGIAMVQQALNNEAVANIFELDADVMARYEHYKDERYQTPEGLLAGMYNQISFVQYPDGTQAFGQDRAEIIEQDLLEDEETEKYYEGLRIAFQEYDEAMERLGIGASYEATKSARAQLATDLAHLKDLYPNRRSADYIGYMPEKLVFEEWVNELWILFDKSIRPYDPGREDYQTYQAYKENYITNINAIMQDFIPPYYKVMLGVDRLSPDLIAPQEEDAVRAAAEEIRPLLMPDINLPQNLKERLNEEFTPENYLLWKRSKHTAHDALMEAWEALAWDTYWEDVTDPNTGKIYDDQDAFHLAQMRHAEKFGPEGTPTDEELVQWVQDNYGPDRFDPEDMMRILNQTTTYTAQDRIAEQGGERYQREQEMWDSLHLVNPGKEWGEFMDMVDVLGEPYDIDADDVGMFMGAMGHSDAFEAEKWDSLIKVVQKAIGQMNLGEPTEVEMQERIDARVAQQEFETLVREQLGEDWFQLQTFWYTLDYSEQAEFKKKFPAEYERLEDGWGMRDVYAVANPTWAKYYHKDIYEAIKQGFTIEQALAQLSAEAGGSGSTGGGVRRTGGGYSSGGGKATPPYGPVGGMRGAETGQELLWKDLGSARPTAKPWWPEWLLTVIGNTAARAVDDAAASGEPIGGATMDYLKNLDNNEQREIVENVQEIYKWLVLQIKERQQAKAAAKTRSSGGGSKR